MAKKSKRRLFVTNVEQIIRVGVDNVPVAANGIRSRKSGLDQHPPNGLVARVMPGVDPRLNYYPMSICLKLNAFRLVFQNLTAF
jgi:hypothetical protein